MYRGRWSFIERGPRRVSLSVGGSGILRVEWKVGEVGSWSLGLNGKLAFGSSTEWIVEGGGCC